MIRENPLEEYYCTNNEEKEYLQSNGFHYSFVKVIQENRPITVWKYKKSKRLYEMLAKLYI